MARLSWDTPGDRYFEIGVDRVVLHTNTHPPVPWNGVTNIEQRPIVEVPTPNYYDGVKFFNSFGSASYEASLEAYTYPDEFAECEGNAYDTVGIMYDGQPRSDFSLVYRTTIGNDEDNTSHGYKIHIIYQAVATPNESSYSTFSEDISPSMFSWTISTLPIEVAGRRPTAHITLDTRKISPPAIDAIENLLYGTSTTPPVLPTPEELATVIRTQAGRVRIISNTTGGVSTLYRLTSNEFDQQADLHGVITRGIYQRSDDSRLLETAVPGIYILE